MENKKIEGEPLSTAQISKLPSNTKDNGSENQANNINNSNIFITAPKNVRAKIS